MRRIIVSCAVGAALLFAVSSAVQPSRAQSQGKNKTAKAVKTAVPNFGNADAITEDELKVYDYFLASDQLEGRYFPSRGYDTAALYVASHLAEWGLKPAGSTAGTNGPLQPYMMPIEMVARTIVPEDSKATLTAPAAGGGRGGAGGRGGQGGGGGARGGQGAGGAARGGANAEPVTTAFVYGKDWTVGGGGGGGGRGGGAAALGAAGSLVFAGNGYVINKTKTNPYEGLDVKGKIIVVAGVPAELAAPQGGGGRGAGGGRGRGGATVEIQAAVTGTQAATTAGANPPAADAAAQPAAGGGRGAAAPNPLGEACTDYWTPEQYAAKNGALAVVTVADFQQAAAMANPNAGGGRGGGGRGGAALNGPPFTPVKFQATSTCPSAPSVTAGMEFVNALFQGEKLSGAQVFYGTGSNAKLDSFELNAQKKLNLHVAVKTEEGHAENVLAMLEGSDPVLKNEFVVVTAHLDHIGLTVPNAAGHNVNNGADDDGSGSTGLLGVAHAYAEGATKGIRPRRSMIFMWVGGEERGLWGSQYFNQFPPIDLSKVVADLNMDMIGRTKNTNSVDTDPTHVLVDPGEVLIVGPNISSDDLEQTIETVNAGYQKLKINHFYDVTAPDATHDNLGPAGRGQRIFYRSDHYNFAKNGIPIAFFTVGLHVDYHRPTDTPEKIDYKEIQSIAKTVGAVGWQLANQNGRPKLKENLPDQLIKDMKTAKDQGWGKITPVLPPLPGQPF